MPPLTDIAQQALRRFDSPSPSAAVRDHRPSLDNFWHRLAVCDSQERLWIGNRCVARALHALPSVSDRFFPSPSTCNPSGFDRWESHPKSCLTPPLLSSYPSSLLGIWNPDADAIVVPSAFVLVPIFPLPASCSRLLRLASSSHHPPPSTIDHSVKIIAGDPSINQTPLGFRCGRFGWILPVPYCCRLPLP